MTGTARPGPTGARTSPSTAFPAALTPDLKALHYLTSPNSVQLDEQQPAAPTSTTGGDDDQLHPRAGVYRCCQHNHGMGWPYYAEELWAGHEPTGGLCASLYAPSTVSRPR